MKTLRDMLIGITLAGLVNGCNMDDKSTPCVDESLNRDSDYDALRTGPYDGKYCLGGREVSKETYDRYERCLGYGFPTDMAAYSCE